MDILKDRLGKSELGLNSVSVRRYLAIGLVLLYVYWYFIMPHYDFFSSFFCVDLPPYYSVDLNYFCFLRDLKCSCCYGVLAVAFILLCTISSGKINHRITLGLAVLHIFCLVFSIITAFMMKNSVWNNTNMDMLEIGSVFFYLCSLTYLISLFILNNKLTLQLKSIILLIPYAIYFLLSRRIIDFFDDHLWQSRKLFMTFDQAPVLVTTFLLIAVSIFGMIKLITSDVYSGRKQEDEISNFVCSPFSKYMLSMFVGVIIITSSVLLLFLI